MQQSGLKAAKNTHNLVAISSDTLQQLEEGATAHTEL